ncbi:RNA 2'-phosphotransferase [Hahella sp. HN01]|uniref:RNA 2'-phosphotransferase n=1 Tax=Hahella sp. HN01 TaxID=2847262 RepID=UPI001C1E972B|nr:RNA 2'-phosphotransferase [Hahella sp. HN01]MBU6951965.1 RNA 2'-phosphotransferase [Hahella sp. HN01]
MQAKFKSIVESIKIQDQNYYYFTHGTYASNWPSILTHGLNPQIAANTSSLGAKTYERTISRDSIRKIKYATAPDIATAYSNFVPENSNGTAIGILLQVRVPRGEFWRAYDRTRTRSKDYWRRESGGEDNAFRLKDKGEYWAGVVVNDGGGPIFALETDQVIHPNDLRVIGYSKLDYQSDPNIRLYKDWFHPRS